MKPAALPSDEAKRLKELYRYEILDTEREEMFDDIVAIASQICGTPIALISLVDPDRQWFKAKVGLDARETNRNVAFCAHAILQEEVFEVPDARQDTRFADNPLVVGAPNVRFYAGAPLISPTGHKLGTLCAIDNKPNHLSPGQRKSLEALARQVIGNMELRLKSKKLEELNQQKNRLFSIIAHDLRSPVKSLLGLVNFLQDPEAYLSDKEREEFTRLLGTTATHVDQLIADLLNWTHFDRGSLRFEPADIPVNQVAERIATVLGPMAKSKGISFTSECPEEIVVRADRSMLHSIMQNLVSNALKFTLPGGQVSLSCEKQGDKALITVKDNGVGLTEASLAKLFSLGSNVSAEGTKGEKGSGLGLPLCQEFAQKMGGKITIQSERNCGTIATAELPLATSQ